VRQLELTHDIVEVFVHLEQPLTYRSGQYTLLQPEAGDIPARCYSFAHHAPDAGSRDVSFFVRRVPDGRLSHWISSAAALHQPVTLSASQGDFYLRSHEHKLLCVAGGSGLAPLVALLEGALQTSARQQDVVLMMGARRQRDLYYLPQIEQLKAQWHGVLSFVPVLSDEPADSDWTGLRGMVTDHLAAEMVPSTQAYLCGPPPMIDAAIARLCTLGMNADQIFSDKFSDQRNAT
jgi:p-cymene monooxygenase electron transfer component